MNRAEFLKPANVCNLVTTGRDGNLSVTRLEICKGTVTETHHEHECIVVVLQGTWRFHLPDRIIAVHQNEALRIPAGVEHSAEALTDTVALNISCQYPGGESCNAFVQDDADQYLWGV